MGFINYVKEEIRVIQERDPAIKSPIEVILYPTFRVMLRPFFPGKAHFPKSRPKNRH